MGVFYLFLWLVLIFYSGVFSLFTFACWCVASCVLFYCAGGLGFFFFFWFFVVVVFGGRPGEM